MKKQYQTPATATVELEINNLLKDVSVKSNAGIKMGGPSSGGTARSRQSEQWDDED